MGPGLDSTAALELMRYMSCLAAMKRTIICSIHQPRQSIWELFHKLELVSEGHVLYFGAPGDAVTWFSGILGYDYLPRRDGMVSDWLLDLVSVGFAKGRAETAAVSAVRSRVHGNGMSSVEDVHAAAARFIEFKGHAGPLPATASMGHRCSESAGMPHIL